MGLDVRHHDDVGAAAAFAVHRDEDVVAAGGVLAAAGARSEKAVATQQDGVHAGFEQVEINVHERYRDDQ